MKFEDIIKLPVIEIVPKLLEGCHKDTWWEQSDWLEEAYSQDQIKEVYKIQTACHIELEESDMKDKLADQMDIVYYAITGDQ